VRGLPIVTIVFSSAISGCQILGEETGAGAVTLGPAGVSEMPADRTGEEPQARQANNAQIENIQWTLVQLQDGAILPGTGNSQVYIRLLPQGNLEGFGGCNRLRGHFEADQGGMRFSRLTTTRKVCPERMEKERVFLQALEAAARWRVEGESLELMSSTGQLLARFEKHEKQEKR
jgi:heat shock protein HslJ